MIPGKLPEKKYFKIGEVADLVGVEPHVLRYWETQFPQIRPHKARSGHRLYRRREVEALLVIRELLHVQRFTIAGARQALRQPGGVSSLLPRFFDAPDGLTTPPTTTTPRAAHADVDADVTDPDGAPASALDDLEDGESLIELEVHGLERAELARALEREAREADGREHVEIDVDAETRAPAPAARPAAPLASPMMPLAPLGLSSSKRSLLEGALVDARAILAILDREDSRERVRA
jgi:DNA-binding transcriptional MerR regulator